MKKHIDFEDIFQHSCNGILVVDRDGHITHINRKAESTLIPNGPILPGKNIIDILPSIQKPLHNCVRTHEAVFGYRISNGKSMLSVNVTPVLQNRQLLGLICCFQELGEKDLEISTQKSILSRQLETIFHSSSDGIWVCDGKGIVISINEASEFLNGIKASDVVGYSVEELLESNVFDQSVTTRVILSRQRETVMQYVAKTNKFLLSTGTPSLDQNGDIVLIVINERDMTELNMLRRKFEQSQKVKEKYKEELSELSLLELHRNSIIAESSKMRQILQMSLKLSHIGASNILILGESGTGKGLIAKLIHKNSSRQKKPFIEINCAALPESLLEAELFGYEKGAFTGASDKGKAGLFELAQGGTIFLDEMGDMPLALQSKILKYLDNQEIRRIGGTESIRITCSIIAATNQDLSSLIKKKLFREDLYYRLNSFVIEIPPLRERTDDILGLVRFYLNEFNKKYRCNKTIGPRAVHFLQTHSYPGNIRELRSIIENAVVMCSTDNIDDFIETSIPGEGNVRDRARLSKKVNLNLPATLKEIERDLLLRAKRNSRTTREMASRLGISQPSVVRKLKRHNIN